MELKYLSDTDFGNYVMFKVKLVESEFQRILDKFEEKTGNPFWHTYSFNLSEQHGIFCDILGHTPGYPTELKEEDWAWWYYELVKLNDLLDEFLTDNFWGKSINKNIKPLLKSYSKTLE